MIIGTEEYEENEEEEEEILLESKGDKRKLDPEISLQAMEGTTSPRTIRLLGLVNRKPVSILSDTGSTHNFMDPSVVQRTGLQVYPEPSSKVTVVRG